MPASASSRIAAQHRDVRAEGRQAGRDGLPVADVGEEAAEDRQPAPGAHRRNDPALRQRGGQPHRLEQHGLAAGVRPADEQGPLRRRSSSRSNGTTGSEPASSSGWRPFTIRSAAGAGATVGHLALDGDRVAGAGDQVVHRDAHLDRAPDGGQLRPQQFGELAEHPQRLPLLLDLRLAQRVAQLDRLGRLDEERARAPRLVVHDAGGPAPRVAADRNDVAAAPHGHRGVGGSGAGVESAEQRSRAGGAAAAARAAPRAGPRRARGSRCRAGCRRRRATAPAAARCALSGRRWESAAASGAGLRHPAEIGVHPPCGAEHALGWRPARPLEHAALDPEPCQRAGDVRDRLGEEPVAPAKERGHLADPGQLAADPLEIDAWAGARARAPRRADRPRRPATSSSTGPNSMVSSASAVRSAGKGDGVPASDRSAPRRKRDGSTSSISPPEAPRARSG